MHSFSWSYDVGLISATCITRHVLTYDAVLTSAFASTYSSIQWRHNIQKRLGSEEDDLHLTFLLRQ